MYNLIVKVALLEGVFIKRHHDVCTYLCDVNYSILFSSCVTRFRFSSGEYHELQ